MAPARKAGAETASACSHVKLLASRRGEPPPTRKHGSVPKVLSHHAWQPHGLLPVAMVLKEQTWRPPPTSCLSQPSGCHPAVPCLWDQRMPLSSKLLAMSLHNYSSAELEATGSHLVSLHLPCRPSHPPLSSLHSSKETWPMVGE
jgi:hypothetical protein